MQIPRQVIHLLSGGMDSVVLLYDLLSELQPAKIHCLLVNYQQRHVQELEWAKFHCHRFNLLYTTVTLPQLRGSELTDGSQGVVVPARNPIMLTIAANLAVAAQADTITIACNKDDEAQFPDCRMAFMQTFNNMLTTAEVPVEVCAPYIDKSKAWIAARGQELGVRFNETWSCYRGGVQPCGKCPACEKRAAAIK